MPETLDSRALRAVSDAVVTIAREHRFELTFRTLSVQQMTTRLVTAGFAVDAVLGDYHGRPWDECADVWIILARRI